MSDTCKHQNFIFVGTESAPSLYCCAECGFVVDFQLVEERDEDYAVSLFLALFGEEKTREVAKVVSSGVQERDTGCPHSELSSIPDSNFLKCKKCGAVIEALFVAPVDPAKSLIALSCCLPEGIYKKILRLIGLMGVEEPGEDPDEEPDEDPDEGPDEGPAQVEDPEPWGGLK